MSPRANERGAIDDVADDVAAAPARPVHVVVVAYGDPGALATCLEALAGAYPVVVVDNSSTPATREVAARAGATYLDPGENLGFSRAVNLGLRQLPLSGVDVLLLNPDAVIGPDGIEALRGALHGAPQVACVAPAQHRPGSDNPAPVCWPFPTPLGAWTEAVGLGRFSRGWGYVIASVLLVRGSALVDVGGLDEGFFLYAEEADWERRATRRGWTAAYRPEISALHVGAATDSDAARREIRFHAGVETYVRKWHGTAGWHSYQAATVLTALRRAVVFTGARRRASLRLARLYLGGPVRTARQRAMIPERSHHVPDLGRGGDAP
jgi:GT2 family glycosyltransferase